AGEWRRERQQQWTVERRAEHHVLRRDAAEKTFAEPPHGFEAGDDDAPKDERVEMEAEDLAVQYDRTDDAEEHRIEEEIHDDVQRRRAGGAEYRAIASGLFETLFGRVRQGAENRQQQRADETRDETATAAARLPQALD